jgi:hypothetical protein
MRPDVPGATGDQNMFERGCHLLIVVG